MALPSGCHANVSRQPLGFHLAQCTKDVGGLGRLRYLRGRYHRPRSGDLQRFPAMHQLMKPAHPGQREELAAQLFGSRVMAGVTQGSRTFQQCAGVREWRHGRVSHPRHFGNCPT